MTVGKTDEIKQELARKVESTKAGTKLKKSMSIADMIKVMEPQIKKALPEVITPERFTRMALSALNTTPKLNECTPMSFLAALMNAAQLGLEPNTPLGQAFLIPYNNKGEMECQFQLGYKGLIDLSYRNPNMQIITAHTVYENDEFEYELGLNPCLNHRPTLGERGEIRLFYGLFKLTNGGFGFEVMSKTAMDDFAKEYSKAFDSSFSPWRTNYESMALKTIIKKLVLSCMWKKIQRGKSENVMLIIDEFQNYIRKGSVLLEMMRESRKYGVSIVLATQTLDLIPQK